MDIKMDTKNLKHRKRQKKSKSGIDKRNNDVLVVPPDILKKLGISIGNTNFVHEITNNNNAGQNIGILNNEATASISMPININKFNESSILETANLMKKSVFLSPTFVSTVNNAIPGQVEISKINYDSCETDRENLPFELPEKLPQKGRKNKNKNNLMSNGNINGDFSGMAIINNTGNLDKNNHVFEDPKKLYTTAEKDSNSKDIATKINCNHKALNGTNLSELTKMDELSKPSLEGNSFLTNNVKEAANNLNSIKVNVITNGQFGTNDKSLKASEIYEENVQLDNNVNSVEEFTVLTKQMDMEIEGNEIRIVAEAENDRISLEKPTLQTESSEVANNSISLEGLEIKIVQGENENNLELEGLAMQIDQEDFQNNLISLEGCDIQLELPEDDNTLISLEKSAIEIEKAEVDNIVYLEECEDRNKLVSIENSIIQIGTVVNNNLMSETDNLITLADLAVQIEKGQVYNNWSTLDGYKMKVGTIENENSLISLNKLGVEIERAEVDNIQISLEQIEIQRDEVDSANIKTLEEEPFQLESAVEESNIRHSTVHIKQAQVENNINIILIDQDSYNNVSMEANLEIICEDLKEISTKDYKDILTGKETNVDSDITMNEQDIIFEKINEHMSQISEGDIQMQKSEMEVEKTDNNNIVLNDCRKAENVCNGFSKDLSIQNDKSLTSTENTNDHDKMIPLNKAIQKVNIISEEIIPASDLKDLKRSNSPIIKSLTPVPLNTIIAPKKASTRKSKRKAAPKLLSASVKGNTALPVITSGDVIEEQKCEESCENILNNKPLNKENLKNNNDSFSCVDNEVSTNQQHIENKSLITDHSRLLHLPKSEKEDILCEGKDINDVSHLNGSILEDDCVKDSNCIENEPKSSTNYTEKTLDKKSNSDDNISRETSISNPDSESKQYKNEVIEKKRKKNKNAGESKNIVVNATADKAFCDTQINNILKSAKDSDTNKVKEIAEYIKRYSHVYKDNKKEISKHINKETNNIKDSINSKTNMIKSKLCIQGVEKPGGNKVEKEVSGKKVLKTYTRERKQQKPSSVPTVDKNDTVSCNIVDATETDLNIADISTSYKTQDFCLCYDFGHLDDYDNSYEHIHFWLHNDNTDLESILSIYNDVEPGDRTKLDDLKISEVMEDNARIDNICWNYFLNCKGDDNKDVEKSNQIQAIDESVKEESNMDVATNYVKIENSDSVSKMLVEADDSVEQCNISNKVVDSDTASDVNMLQSVSNGYDVITIVEMIDCKDEDILESAKSNSTSNTTIEKTISNKNDTHDHIKQTPQETQKECPKTDTPKEIKKNKKVTITNTDNKKDDGGDNNKTEAEKQTTSKTNRENKEVDAIPEPESSNQSNRKRKFPVNDTSDEPSAKKNVKCGVCDKVLAQDKWDRHVVHKHGFIAWKSGQSFNFEDPDLIKKLKQKIETTGHLRCATCSLQTTKFKKYISHVKVCSQHKESRRGSTSRNLVECGVCHQDVSYLLWNEHIGKEHNYLAWIDGQPALKTADEAAVTKHLQTILKANGGLTCYKCGLNRKRVKVYLSHVENCDGSQVTLDESSMSVEASIQESQEDSEPLSSLSTKKDKKTVTCGVCKDEVPVVNWTEHIAKEHYYMAWEDGDTPLNVDDEEAVRNHLQEFIRHSGGLMCYKCGLNRKRVKMYLSHIKTCDGQGVNLDASAVEDVNIEETDAKIFECGVCHAKVTVLEWNEHIGREHNYLAWKVGATPLDVNNEDAVKEHLLEIIRSCDGLTCYKCGLNRRRVKLYLSHIKTCDGTNRQDISIASSNSMIEITIDGPITVLKCGVCAQNVAESLWFEHIGREHKYLAWEHGQEPLDIEDEDAVKEHLLFISKHNNGLICNKCQVTKKYPKVFLQHVKECTGLPILDESLKTEQESIFDVSHVTTATVTCGVCHNSVQTDQWLTHMEKEHDYLAWLDGKEPLDLEDITVVQKHLIEVSKRTNGLKCKKCGLVRKYAKSYLQHTESCGSGFGRKDIPNVNGGAVECAVCHAEVDPRDWRDHAMKKHYNVAWVVGGTPIEINNPYGVEPCIKEYQARHNNKLVCKTCGIHRVSAVGFYAHIITCGKTEEEQEIYKNLCEICNNKYLRIYKSQHMTMHREKEHAIKRKILMAKTKELKKEENEPVEIVGGRRKAAEKAKTVIEKYTSKIIDGSRCSQCGFISETEAEMKDHVCVAQMYSGSDSDESVDLEHSSEEDDDTDVDSNISDEEKEARDREMTRSRRHGDSSAKIKRLPYQVKNLNTYMRKSAEEFVTLHLTDKDLFPEWRYLEIETVLEEEIPRYMPPLEESCKVRHGEAGTWQTYKRFEAKKQKDVTTMFTGACIQCICWVPPYTGQCDVGPVREYLSVVTHLSADVPRHHWQDKPAEGPVLVQIWDCGDLVRDVPELVLGVSLEYGTIWSLDWCPSGARDVFDPEGLTTETYRLGLFAAACSNGSAYVFAVPHPSTIKDKDNKFFKLTPVAELRLAMCSNRKTYQATAIKWSAQKGHAHIVVGYADGTTAYFDLKNESPMLKSREKNLTVFYPYHDERAQSMCIEDVDVFPTRSGGGGGGVVAAGSVGGAGAWHAQSHAAATRALYPPHWPAALLAGDDNLVSQVINEVEWFGSGRRVGGMRACCGCAWCARVAAVSAPTIRLLRTHPAYTDLHRQVIATLQMVPFGNKRKRKNDELSMIMEPLTYEDAIIKYGIEFKQITAKDRNTQQKLSGLPREAYPERFPLSDVTSMLFCPSARNHHKLAVATHAGLLFIINV